MLFQPQHISFLLLILSILVLLVWVFLLDRKIHRLLARDLGRDFPETLELLGKKVKEYDAFMVEISHYLSKAEKRMLRSTQATSLVRFNAFKNDGLSGQSFALASIDEEGSGIILSTLYARDRVSVYAKPLVKFVSTFELTEEEGKALALARKKLAVR